MLTKHHSKTDLMVFHLCLQTNGSEANNWLAGSGPQLDVMPRDYY
jgi:hypothetical protein